MSSPCSVHRMETVKEKIGAQPPSGPVAAGYAALKAGEWARARNRFEEANRVTETPEAYEGLSWAAWFLNDAEALFDARERAYGLYRSAGDNAGAARMAAWLGTDHVDFRDEPAVAEGWFGRARRLLEEVDLGAEHGWLWVHEAEKLLLMNDTMDALELASSAVELGRSLGVVDLEMMGLATKGLVLVTDGEVPEGIACLDEAAAAVLGGELEATWAAGWCLCYMLYACERVRDYDRAAQWCRRIEEWSEERRMSLLGPICRAHYGVVLIWRGSWVEAEEELRASAEHLAEIRPPHAVEAKVRMAELRRRQGRVNEAAEFFEEAGDHPLALIGLGEVCLDGDDLARALDLAEAYLRDVPPRTGTLRAIGLDLLVRTLVALGQLDRASTALQELEALADVVATDPLRASVSFADGLVALASGEPERARAALEDATRLYRRSGAPFEEARARIELARALGSIGRRRDAKREAVSAMKSLGRMGAAAEAARAADLARTLEGDGASSPLTKREREVLGLVAEGLADRAIADRLVLSQHTVHRHVANILRKLGCTSRSAAVAEALRKGWA
jgi:DNA-binding NarL/FixJ family response regulator